MNTNTNAGISEDKKLELIESSVSELLRIREEMAKIEELVELAKTRSGIDVHFAHSRSVMLRMRMTETRRNLQERLGV